MEVFESLDKRVLCQVFRILTVSSVPVYEVVELGLMLLNQERKRRLLVHRVIRVARVIS
jgi:hypothetical protein